VDKYSTSGTPQVTVKVWKWVATLLWEASDIHLYFNQHYSYTHGALSTAGPARPHPLVSRRSLENHGKKTHQTWQKM